MDTAWAALAVTPYALVVAFTTMPVLSVLAVLLGTRRASRGLWLATGYAAGLLIVFTLAELGIAEISWIRRFHPTGLFNLAAGLLLILVAVLWWIWDRRRVAGAEGLRSSNKFLDWMGTLGPFSCGLIGFQFAFHPANLVLTIVAAREVVNLRGLPATLVMLWFCLVGVSTVALPSLFYARSGEGARARLQSVRDWLEANGTTITVTLVLAVGVALSLLGLSQQLG